MNLPKENTDSALDDIGVRKNFLSRTPFAQELTPTVGKCIFIKLKSFCTSKETINQVKNGRQSLLAIHLTED